MNHKLRVFIYTLLAIIIALVAIGEQRSLAQGTIIFVDADATGANNGSSWADAYTTLQPALDAAVSGDQIWVAEGTYTPTVVHGGGKSSRFRSFQLENGVALYGGFDPTSGDTMWGERDWISNVTILSGDLKGDDHPNGSHINDNSYHVFYHPAALGLDTSAILDGFTIRGGNANLNNYPHGNGGGMFNEGASPTLTNCIFLNNYASRGGGMTNAESSPTLINCTFMDNSSNYGGGGIDNQASSPSLANCTFSGNSAEFGGGMFNMESSPMVIDCLFSDNSATYGGGMYNLSSFPTMTNCSFTSNMAVDHGGGMVNAIYSSPTLSNCTFSGNTASMGGGMYNLEQSFPTLTNSYFVSNSATYGGGIYNTGSSSPILDDVTLTGNQAADGAGIYNIDSSAPVLTDVTFTENAATWAGGGMQNIRSSPTIKDCIFQSNAAGISGGGINNSDSSSPIMTNTIFWGNTSENGGGMHNYNSFPVLTNCTFASNTATYGGAIRNYAGANPVLTNSILWANTPDQFSGDAATVTYSDVEGGYFGVYNIALDPLFLDITTGDLHLSIYSPAIDTGSNSAAYLPELDFEGDARIIDGDFDGTATVDMGVDEAAYEAPPMVVYYVDQDATGANNGTSWTDAFTTLQPALEAARSGDQIWVAAGIYKPTNEFNTGDPRSAHFQMKNDVAIYGGFSGSESSLDERDWVNNETILSCDLNGDDGLDFTNNAENCYHVFYHPSGLSLTSTAILDGFMITGGNAGASYGGGMHNFNSSPQLSNCTFSGNSADYGGGMYNRYYSSPTLTDVTYSGNSASYGGGMYNEYISSPGLTRVIFEGNTASYGGGGLYNYISAPVLTDCTFTGNTANSGGGVNNTSSSPSLTECIFDDNWGGLGGGMFNDSSASPMLTNCTFMNNSAVNGGGMYNSSYDTMPTLTNCSFDGNTASNEGGGMHNYGANPRLVNIIFSGNSAKIGGGVYNASNAAPHTTNCTFYGNVATSAGGGFYNYWYSNPIIANTILWGNSPNQIANDNSTPTVYYSDVQGGYTGTGNIDDDPLFADPVNNDLHLGQGSPAIDTGYNNAGYIPAIDFEGDPRILDGNGDGTAIVDMGVDEYNPESSARLGGALKLKAGQQADKVGLARLSWQPVAILAVAGFYAVIPELVRKYSARNIPR